MIKKLAILLAILAAVLTSCTNKPVISDNLNALTPDLDSIMRRGKLIAVSDYNSTDYFIYKGEPMGFNFELLKAFTDHLGIDLEIIAENHKNHALSLLNSGDADLLAFGLTANSTYDPDMVLSTPVSFVQNIAWGLRKNNSGKLLNELNQWIDSYRKTGSYALLYAKYFRNSRSETIIKSDYYYINTGRISQWDDIIKSASTKINWDWRLLASLICQESRFDPDVESRVGAYGLMQVMPVNGKNFDIDITASPSSNIRAGTMYINRLQLIFETKITDPEERIKFILASYNAGPGHVLDAMKLAGKNGMNPEKWDGNVAVWLLKKSDPKYYNDSVVKNGYFRGTESVNFVAEVLERYDHYRNIIPENIRLSMVSDEGRRQSSDALIIHVGSK